jgi:predicted nucleotidyltransferase
MPSEIVNTLLHTQAILRELGVPSALMGGLAVSAWDHVRATEDVDILIGVAAVDLDGLLRVLQDRGYRPKLTTPIVDFDGERVVQLIYQPPGKFFEFRVDLFLAETEYHKLALDRRTVFRLPDDGTEIPILTVEDLILFKLHADRIIDRRDVVSLLAEHRDTIDLAYLSRWLTTDRVRAVWNDCWTRAFPGEADPTAPG